MLVSTKGRYALSVIIDLAEHDNEGYIPLSDIAARQGISKKYLEAIIKDLVKEKMVKGIRGKGGGYKLAVDPGKCTAWDVIKATEDNFTPVSCVTDDHAACPNKTACKTLPMWIMLDRELKIFFEKYRISDLISEEPFEKSNPNT
ncbi:MAG: Rrf2 family transcriptional regulator [Lachnospiraceae bacterium]|nr:Rrf2 family transcriptional regulator [Lachnospiraceae bacterium]